MKKNLILTALLASITTVLFAQDPAFFEGENGLWGLKDRNGKEVIAPKYAGVRDFIDGIAVVRTITRNEDELGGLATNTRKYGYIDINGKEITALKYDAANNIKEGYAAVQLNGKWGFINKAGKEIIGLKYDEAKSFSEGLAVVKLNNKFGYIDKTGKEVIPIKYNTALSFEKTGFAKVYIGVVPFSIDKSGKLSQY